MKQGITIALDAMGGDYAPQSVLEGAALTLKRHPGLRFKLYGDSAAIEPLLQAYPQVKAVSELVHTEEKVASDAKPSVALRQGAKTSMRLAIDAVKKGEAQGVVSSGNTGALMAMSKYALKTLPHISRPAIVSVLPTLKNPCIMLDAGGNIDCDARALCQFAVMGDAFMRAVFGVSSPSIGLLNVGAEEIKGHDTLKLAYHTLKQVKSLNFHGFVEGTDIGRNTVDVVVTDGFTGNITLKTLEGTAHFVATSLKRSYRNSLYGRLAYLLSAPALLSFKKKMDPRNYNGGVFIGLNGVTVKSHGNADGVAFANAVNMTYELIVNDVNGKITEELHRSLLDQSHGDTLQTEALEL